MFDSDYYSITAVPTDSTARGTGKYTRSTTAITKHMLFDKSNKPYSKNGICIMVVMFDETPDHYELTMDGEYLSKVQSIKEAIALFKDFSA